MGDDGIHGSVAVLCATAESRRTLVYVTSGKGTGETRGCTRAGAHVGAHKSSTWWNDSETELESACLFEICTVK